jgi:hypothetical protein
MRRNAVEAETRPDSGATGAAADGEVPADNWGLPPDFDLKAYPHGTAEVSESGIDLSQLRNNLRLSPEERLAAGRQVCGGDSDAPSAWRQCPNQRPLIQNRSFGA